MDERQDPIGVFDSGIGGISVLRELVALMPNENYVYFGDSANAPYGTKTLGEVQKLSLEGADYLVRRGAKALVIACNTATGAAIQLLRDKYADMPVIGIEPAIKPAVLAKKDPTVLVMATPMTIREEKFQRLMLQYRDRARIYTLPCPGLMEFVEQGIFEGPTLENYLKELFAVYEGVQIDSVVLGCTHYPFIKKTIQKLFGGRTALFDGGMGTARETQRRLKVAGLLNLLQTKGEIVMENSLGSAEILKRSRMLLHMGNSKQKEIIS